MKKLVLKLSLAAMMLGGCANQNAAFSDFEGIWTYVGGSSRVKCPDETGATFAHAGQQIAFRRVGDRIIAFRVEKDGREVGERLFVYIIEGNGLQSDGTQTICSGNVCTTQTNMLFILEDDIMKASANGFISLEGKKDVCSYTLEGTLRKNEQL